MLDQFARTEAADTFDVAPSNVASSNQKDAKVSARRLAELAATPYDQDIRRLLKKRGHWSDAEYGEAVQLCIAMSKVWPPEGLDPETANEVGNLHYVPYRRLRDAIGTAKITGPIGARAVVLMMLDEVYEGHDHERVLLNKLLAHLSGPAELRNAA